MSRQDIYDEILRSKVYDVAIKTPLDKADKLSMAADCHVYLKREDLQPVHSFKIRGAYNKIAQLSEQERRRGVITASAGNHAQGVALVAQKLGISALIVMPQTTPSIKIDAVKSYDADVELEGDNYSEAAEYCKQRITQTGRTYIHPFDDPLVIAGQGTIGMEIMKQLPNVTHIFVPVGGGGLIAGIASFIKQVNPHVKIIGVEPEESNAMQVSVPHKKPVTLPQVGIFADGVAVTQVGIRTHDIARNLVDDFITVTTDQICHAIKSVFEETRGIVEPAGALAVAGISSYNLPKDAHTVAICSGANMTFERLQQVIERTHMTSGSAVRIAVKLNTITTVPIFYQRILKDRHIRTLQYYRDHNEKTSIFFDVSITQPEARQKFILALQETGHAHVELPNNDHISYFNDRKASDELSYTIDFPEHPSTFGHLLDLLDDQKIVTSFHYSQVASDRGTIDVRFKVYHKHKLEQLLSDHNLTWKYPHSSVDTLGAFLFDT